MAKMKIRSEIEFVVMAYLNSLDDRLYKVMTEAMSKGSAIFTANVLTTRGTCDLAIFSGFPYVSVEQIGADTYKIVASELRKIWQRNCVSWAATHKRWNEIVRYATAAARLYGAISIRDFIMLLKQYKVDEWLVEPIVEQVLRCRSLGDDTRYAVVDGELRWADFAPDALRNAYEMFLERRHDGPRCLTLSREEFLAYSADEYVEDCEPVRALNAFLLDKISEERTPEMLTRALVADLIRGLTPQEIVAGYPKDAFPNVDAYADTFEKTIAAVRDAIRLPIYNGHTNLELGEKGR